jgi:hypothetical protein
MNSVMTSTIVAAYRSSVKNISLLMLPLMAFMNPSHAKWPNEAMNMYHPRVTNMIHIRLGRSLSISLGFPIFVSIS